MRTRFYSAAAIFLLLALSFSANIYSQQTGAARRQPNNPSEASTSANTKASSNSRVSGARVKSDLAEALSVIQDNYIDGKKLDYNSIFKSSISGMLNVLDPHSTYLDAADFNAFKTEQRSEYFGIGATIGDLHQGDDLNTYIRATFQDAPREIDVVFTSEPDTPSTGTGEPGSVPTAAAIANAVFEACGVRVRRLPLSPAAISAARG